MLGLIAEIMSVVLNVWIFFYIKIYLIIFDKVWHFYSSVYVVVLDIKLCGYCIKLILPNDIIILLILCFIYFTRMLLIVKIILLTWNKELNTKDRFFNEFVQRIIHKIKYTN